MLTTLRRDIPQWRRIRAEALPPHVVEAAAAARSAGDWRRAAELARTEVSIDLEATRQRFGGVAADELEDDLRHLCLDLLWWHLPRHRGGMTTLHPRVSAVLAPSANADAGPLLRVRLPKSPAGPQRLRLDVTTFGELESERWYVAPRYTWDVRETLRLRSAWGGSPTRLPLLTPDGRPLPPDQLGVGDDEASRTERVYLRLAAGDLAAAWEECGFDVTEVDPEALQQGGVGPACPIGLASDVRAASRVFNTSQVNTLYGARLDIDIPDTPSPWREPASGTSDADPPDSTAAHPGALSAVGADLGDYLEIPVRLATDGVPADLILIAAGHRTPGDLHPLMRAALFPSAPANPPRTPPRPAAPPTAQVRCQGTWHTVTIADRRLRMEHHTDAEVQREETLRALGGTSTGCFAVQLAWTTGTGRLPHTFSATVREVRHRMQHGDTPWLLEGLREGVIDPLMRDSNGWSLLHMAMWVDFRQVVRGLLQDGVPVDARDKIGRTPLYLAAMNGGHPDFMRLLLDCGADPRAETEYGAYPSYIAKHRNDWQDLAFLSQL
ncbi:ankyrin repeat domain-containing protein [Dactylosporangium sp. AC04546]|uniref:ankyrin repeat domain-containing protein n=1 Tax=Dactylosporangium sp. AC04546 TaxID=2862460 RepID=UPI001EDCDC94|nr:ankyrin repeat domain-containing protein [Dactylosporangium sp. AC04546]WVK84304.1 ankyrin repeat domain-containing protein [Dactylosporangium sp. AC04546]